MPINILDYAKRLSEWKKASESLSQLLVSCLESIDASLWLIAGGRVPQALVMLHNSIELAFKAELERIHRVLIADNRKLDYTALKSLLKNLFEAHPRGKQINIPDFDMEKTINFTEAMKRIEELYPLIGNWKSGLERLQLRRNDIVHYGTNIEKNGEYVGIIATVAFPFLELFLQESSNISIENMVTPEIFREIEVAKNVCNRLKQENYPIESYVLKTISKKMLYTHVDWPEVTDEEGNIIDNGEKDFMLAMNLRKIISSKWEDSYVERSCHICDSISTFVKVAPITKPNKKLLALAVRCPKCDLNISENDRYLAENHVGKFSEKEVESFFKEFGL